MLSDKGKKPYVFLKHQVIITMRILFLLLCITLGLFNCEEENIVNETIDEKIDKIKKEENDKKNAISKRDKTKLVRTLRKKILKKRHESSSRFSKKKQIV